MGFRNGVFLTLVLLANVTGSPARAAEPTAGEKETARAMMDAGHARRDADDHKGALAQFQGADAIMHVPTTGLEVAREQAALGLLVEARDTVQRILRTPPAGNEPEAFATARSSAQALDESLAKRIPALRISVNGAASGASIQVAVDGMQVPMPALIAPFKVNPGHHVVSATMEGTTVREEADVAAGQTADVGLNLVLPSAPSPSSAPPEAAALPRDTGAASTEGNASPPIVSWLRWGGFGLAAVGIGVGSATGAMSLSATGSASRSCVNNQCPPSTWSDIDSAHTTATISTVSFVAAGVGAALGVTSFLIASPAAPAGGPAASRPHVSPWIGAG
ncbi:MAG TPA: hypothetical protein VGY54_15525, partial [Polyangiaceae bacterium]|nr:hypothetical protein [Polyangiaceae bacterium]